MARTDNGESGPYLVPRLHLVDDLRPRWVLSQVGSISKYIETVLSAGQRDIDSIGALQESY